MSFLRNPEIKRDITLWFAMIIVFSASAAAWLSPLCGAVVLTVSLIFLVVFLHTEYRRYKRTAKLAENLDRVLYHNEIFDLSDFSEGDLAILQSELTKMTVRLREQSESLTSDKQYLADLITDISHQIRTPLTSVNLICSFLEEPELSEERRHELTGELSRLLQRMDWLIEALLKMSKLDAGTANMKSEEIKVSDILDQALSPVAILTDIKNQTINVKGVSNAKITGDLRWQTEAIGNIVKNCVEHTAEDGRIEISVRENAIFTEIAISDNGSGIDPSDLPHLFERFYKGKNSSDSSVGVGLALSRMIISDQNGTVKAENCSQGGAKFTVKYYKSIC